MRPDELQDDREVDDLLRRLDHPLPPITVEMVVQRARRAGVARLKWAAGIAVALALASGVAYAAPGSPLREWIAQAGRALHFGPPAEVPSAPVGTQAAESSGIALVPGESLVIEFLEPGLSGYVRVDLGDDAEVVVRAPTGSTRFVSEPERLRIEHPTTDTVHVVLPRAGGRVVIRVGARELLQKNGEQITATQAPGGDGGFVFVLGLGLR